MRSDTIEHVALVVFALSGFFIAGLLTGVAVMAGYKKPKKTGITLLDSTGMVVKLHVDGTWDIAGTNPLPKC